MKKVKIFRVAAWVAAIFLLSAGRCLAQTAEQVSAAKGILSKAPAAELASKSAQLVANAPANGRAAVAAAVAQSVASINPDVVSAAVAAIASKVPVVAPAAAAAAASKLPNSAGAIAVSAASVPGVMLNDVRSAVIAAVPLQAGQVVSALAQAKLSSSLNSMVTGFSVASSSASVGSKKQ